MDHAIDKLDQLQRPSLLIRAARIGSQSYRRATHLRNFFGYGALSRSCQVLRRLSEVEMVLNQQRQENDAGYSAVRHVEVLIAMMGEARILRASPEIKTLGV